jgi:DUF438 domain-containing protein
VNIIDSEYVDIRKFIGTLEVIQDATEVRSLEGEQRLHDWE